MINGSHAIEAKKRIKSKDFMKLFLYMAVTYGISWPIWFLTKNPAIQIIGSCMPSIAGLCFLLTSKDQIHKGFFKRAANFKQVQLRWYMFILFAFPMVMLLSYLAQKLLGGAVPSLDSFIINISKPQNLALIFFLSFGAGLGEEFGWRGFMLETLQKHFGRTPSSLIVGFVWAAWHIPLSVKNNESLFSISFLNYFAFVVLLSVLIAIVYNNNNRSILSTILFHGMVNFTQYIMFMNETVPMGMSIIKTLFLLLTVVLLSIGLNRRDTSAKI